MMGTLRCFFFGEAEKGALCAPKICKSLEELLVYFGQPSKESGGIYYAIQALLLGREVIFFRVREEGYSYEDYHKGFALLKAKACGSEIDAIFIPGVGTRSLIDEISLISSELKSLLIINHKDFYDYMTDLS